MLLIAAATFAQLTTLGNLSPAEVRALLSTIHQLEQRVKRLEGALQALTPSKVDALQLIPPSAVAFDPGAKGYSWLSTPNGIFVVTLREIRPYADGQMIIMDVGNPYSIKFSNLTFRVVWNKAMPPATNEAALREWANGAREREFTETVELHPAKWNRVSLILPDTLAENVGYIAISMESERVHILRTDSP